MKHSRLAPDDYRQQRDVRCEWDTTCWRLPVFISGNASKVPEALSRTRRDESLGNPVTVFRVKTRNIQSFGDSQTDSGIHERGSCHEQQRVGPTLILRDQLSEAVHERNEQRASHILLMKFFNTFTTSKVAGKIKRS